MSQDSLGLRSKKLFYTRAMKTVAVRIGIGQNNRRGRYLGVGSINLVMGWNTECAEKSQ